jgi:rsbT co-antagonist protein RsbR
VRLAERLAVLDLSPLAAWVSDPQPRIVWANARAVKFWGARDATDLCGRDLSDLSEASRVQQADWLQVLQSGATLECDWRLYPLGVPIRVRMYMSAMTLDDGRLGILFQARPKEDPVDPDLARGAEALRHTSVAVAFVSADGEILTRNPAAIRAFGGTTPLAAWFEDERVAPAILAAFRVGEIYRADAASRASGEERWYVLEARPTVDPMTGARVMLVHLVDDTARRRAARDATEKAELIAELRRALALVEEQRRRILELSVPVIRIGPGALAVPIVGEIDGARLDECSPRLLSAVVEHGARFVVLDLTGARTADTAEIDALARLVRALGLLGARVILTGFQPALARGLAASDARIVGAIVLRSLAEGINMSRTGPPW